MSRALVFALPLLLLAAPSWGQGGHEIVLLPVGICDPRDVQPPGCPDGLPCACVDCPGGLCAVEPTRPPVSRDCRRQSQEVEDIIEKLVERHAYCRRDSDCVALDTSTACSQGCPAFVNRRVDSRLARQIRHLSRRRCQDCLTFGARCLPQRPACVQNRCRALPLVPPQPSPKRPGRGSLAGFEAPGPVQPIPVVPGLRPVGAGAVFIAVPPEDGRSVELRAEGSAPRP